MPTREAHSADEGRAAAFVVSAEETGAFTSRSIQPQTTTSTTPATTAAASPVIPRRPAQRRRRFDPARGAEGLHTRRARQDGHLVTARGTGRRQSRHRTGVSIEPERRLAGDVGLFRELAPARRPRGDRETELLAEPGDLGGERLADLVVVAHLEPELAVALVPR